MQRVGVPRCIVDCLFSTLQEAQHKVRTGYGDSEGWYGGSQKEGPPMHGICQGNGAGPSIWAVVSSPILNLLRTKGYGIFFTTPISNSQIRFSGYAFVDDSDLIPVLSALQKAGLATLLLQKSVDTWEAGLKVTGGALVPEKTFWYLIAFE
jgi:hypothetical protein